MFHLTACLHDGAGKLGYTDNVSPGYRVCMYAVLLQQMLMTPVYVLHTCVCLLHRIPTSCDEHEGVHNFRLAYKVLNACVITQLYHLVNNSAGQRGEQDTVSI